MAAKVWEKGKKSEWQQVWKWKPRSCQEDILNLQVLKWMQRQHLTTFSSYSPAPQNVICILKCISWQCKKPDRLLHPPISPPGFWLSHLPSLPPIHKRSRLTFAFWLCPLPVVPRGSSPLPLHTYHPGGHQAGSEGREGNHREAEGKEAGADHLPPGPGSG